MEKFCHGEVLQIVLDVLGKTDIVWVLTGSASFAIQGVSLVPNDLDIQTTERGAYAIEGVLPGKVMEPVREVVSQKIRSHLGAKLISGVKVEIMGDVRKRLSDDGWEPFQDLERLRIFVPWNGYEVPVLPLAYEKDAYERLGRYDTAKKIGEFIYSS